MAEVIGYSYKPYNGKEFRHIFNLKGLQHPYTFFSYPRAREYLKETFGMSIPDTPEELIMQLTKKETSKKEFSEKEWYRWECKRRRELEKELKRIYQYGNVRSHYFAQHYEHNGALEQKTKLGEFLWKRYKLVTLNF